MQTQNELAKFLHADFRERSEIKQALDQLADGLDVVECRTRSPMRPIDYILRGEVGAYQLFDILIALLLRIDSIEKKIDEMMDRLNKGDLRKPPGRPKNEDKE